MRNTILCNVALAVVSLGMSSRCGAADLTIPQAVYKNDRALTETLVNEGRKVDEVFAGTTGLHLAAELGYIELAKLLLAKGANPNTLDDFGRTPLMWAARNRHPHVARLVLDAGASPALEDRSGDNALAHAAYGDSLEVAKMLVAHGVKVRADNAKPLAAVAQSDDAELALLLLQTGADPCREESSGWTALHIAARNGSLEVTEVLVDHITSCELKEDMMQGAMERAARQGHLALVQYLLGKTTPGLSTLNDAITSGHLEIAELLLKQPKLLPAKRYDSGESVIVNLLRLHRPDLFSLLLKHHVNLDAELGLNPAIALVECAAAGDLENMRLLLDHGASVNKVTQWGATALEAAAGAGRLDAVKLLLERGANLRYRDKEGRNALLAAAMNGNVGVCVYLVSRGIDVNSKDKKGLTALHHAADFGHDNLVRELLKLKANPGIRDREGKTALDHARVRGAQGVIEILKAGSA